MTNVETLNQVRKYDPIMWTPDNDLDSLKQGKPLTVEELSDLPDDSVVYVTYKDVENDTFVLHRAMRLRQLENGEWTLSDGESIHSTFTLSEEDGESQALSEVEDHDFQGVMRLWKAMK